MLLLVGTAFVAGLISFVSPCVLPLVPAYISFISGHSLAEFNTPERSEKVAASVLITAVFFVLGFSVIFLMMGAAAGALGHELASLKPILIRVGGVIVIFFGLQLAGVFQLIVGRFLKSVSDRVGIGAPRQVG